MKEARVKAIYIRAGKAPELIEIDNELHVLQEKIGGYIQMVPLNENLALVCDEEGLLKGKTMNVYIGPTSFHGEMNICGDVLIVGTEEDEIISIDQWDLIFAGLSLKLYRR